jgi:hypothetical protein
MTRIPAEATRATAAPPAVAIRIAAATLAALALLPSVPAAPGAEPASPDRRPVSRTWTLDGIAYEGTPILVDANRIVIRHQRGSKTISMDLRRLAPDDRRIAKRLEGLDAVKPVAMSLPRPLRAPAPQDHAGPVIPVPVLASHWWQIAEKAPDVHPYNNAQNILAQDACDFTIWQDANGLWHLVSCIRSVADETKTVNRIFHEWTSEDLTAQFWTPRGIFLVPDASRGERPSGIQAPHAFVHDGKYYLFYSSGAALALISDDGATWRRLTDHRGSTVFFKMGRDVNLFLDGETWYAYYTTDETVYRTADNLRGPWSQTVGNTGHWANPESPFALKKAGRYYLWAQMNVFISETPERFDGPLAALTVLPEADRYDPAYRRGTYAPEIFQDRQGQWYIAGYADGIFVARLDWVDQTPAQMRRWLDEVGRPEMIRQARFTLDFYKDRDTSKGWAKKAVERARRNLGRFGQMRYEFLD